MLILMLNEMIDIYVIVGRLVIRVRSFLWSYTEMNLTLQNFCNMLTLVGFV
jgi:hypothetical protein